MDINESRRVQLKLRLLALAAGVACHLLFLGAVALMAFSLYSGMQVGFGPFEGTSWALIANTILVFQFPIIHSFLLSTRGREVLSKLVMVFGVSREVGQSLSTTTFAAIASVQLLLVFALWSPSEVVYWEAHGATRLFFDSAFLMGWLFLLRSMWDAGIELQTGFLGWSSVLRGKQPTYRPFRVSGVFRFCRQPIYCAFALIIWSSPVMTLDKLLLAAPWTIYLLIGPRLKEERFLRWYGDAYRAYQAEVPYFLPSLSLLISHFFEGPIA